MVPMIPSWKLFGVMSNPYVSYRSMPIPIATASVGALLPPLYFGSKLSAKLKS